MSRHGWSGFSEDEIEDMAGLCRIDKNAENDEPEEEDVLIKTTGEEGEE
jgi:hypothetical protein